MLYRYTQSRLLPALHACCRQCRECLSQAGSARDKWFWHLAHSRDAWAGRLMEGGKGSREDHIHILCALIQIGVRGVCWHVVIVEAGKVKGSSIHLQAYYSVRRCVMSTTA